jgi:phosphoribosylformimino-5-aminoimidazole carboxamide ribotide isomerase
MSDMINQAKIIPVLDIKGGLVVHGVAGEREKYKPVSGIAESSNPVEIASTFQKLFGVDEIYVADLDAITKKGSNLEIITRIRETTGLNILLDYGIRLVSDIEPLLKTGIDSVVVATETMRDLDIMEESISKFKDNIVGSLDLKMGMPISSNPDIVKTSPIDITKQFEKMGLSRLIILEISLVGTSKGPIHEVLINVSKETSMRIVSGGGVRYRQDLVDLFKIGVTEALVATALHKGHIKPE